jgi:glycosyltransferase involved in cell wall biosynthesis
VSDRSHTHILVGQIVDDANNNPQCLNTKMLLSRSAIAGLSWSALFYNPPDPAVARVKAVRLVRLWRWRFWMGHKFLFYQRSADAIFYPGVYWFDDLALQLRKKLGRRVPVIATMEGFVGSEKRERKLSDWAGHKVFCQRAPEPLLKRIDRVLNEADHVIAISPFIADMGRRLYGDKFSVLPLGVDREVFYPRGEERLTESFTIIGAGRLYENKRPQLFVEMAKRFPSVSFIWYGDGELRNSLQKDVAILGLQNIEFRAAISNRLLGEEFRNANVFVLPSRAEGVPKVTQEAAACGLPVIACGFYESPTVIDGQNGYVVWSNEQLFQRVEELIENRELAFEIGLRGAEMAKEWDWDKIAPRWENQIFQIASQTRA